MADANQQKLGELLHDVGTDNPAVQAMLDDLAAKNGVDLFGDASDTPDTEPQTDRAEELRELWATEEGQLWAIPGKAGEHRLLCGDSTKEDDVRRLMGDVRAGLMNTDPPYGVSYANDERPNPGVAKPRVAKPRVANDTLADADLQAFLELAFGAASNHALRENAAWYMWHAHLTQGYFAAAAAAAAAGVILHRQIIWVKPVLLLGRGQYHWKHEPCFMGWRSGHQPPDYGEGHGERTQTTVWEVDSVNQSDRKEYNHSTPKPVGLFTIPIVKHLKRGEVCYEPFAGSGPQFIAAEQLSRLCYGIEISPAYCAVILQRMTDAGLEPYRKD
jgi:DNA modification methylase